MHRLAKHLRTRLHDRSRGQSLAEFALVLPIILFLTLTALDFGRVYLGYINLQNMARIAANFAANNPEAWTPTADPTLQATRNQTKTKYQNEILGDAVATNCNLPLVAGVRTAPNPTFTDADLDGTPEIGDTAHVAITCSFGVITPGISRVVGSTVQVSAASTFPVKTGMTVPAGSVVVGSAPNAAFMGNGVQAPSSLSGTTPFTVTFNDTSGSNPTNWAWDFDGNLSTIESTERDPVHQFTAAGTYVVTLTASNLYGSSTESMGITVVDPTTADFTMSPSSTGTAPLTVNFADASSSGATAWAWTFGAGQGSGSGKTTSHTYNTAGTYIVQLTVTFPSGPVAVSKTVSVSTTLCTVPSLNGVRRNNAQAAWNAALFTGTVTDGPGAASGNYVIKSQSEVAGDVKPCNIGVVVNSK
jgi:PKD repeat protein